MKAFIYQKEKWPHFSWDADQIIHLLGKVRHLQGLIIGKMQQLGFDLQSEAILETVTQDVLKSNEIEGEILNPEQVRSSVARRLGIEISGLVYSDQKVEGVVEMMLDATQNYDQALSNERLFAWHTALFPGGRSGMTRIIVGDWRDDSTGPMQVVSGALGKEKVHFQAIEANQIDAEMKLFIDWFNEESDIDPILKAALMHLWFITIHPFEDGNGRIARALTDMQLARADKIPKRFYSMSSQIRVQRKEYYLILEKTQQGTLNITPWLLWFLECLYNALEASEEVLEKVLFKHYFWNKFANTPLNERQKKILNMLIDGFDGKLSSSKWAKINKCSSDTALRDIQNLIDKHILRKEKEGGRSTNYELNDFNFD